MISGMGNGGQARLPYDNEGEHFDNLSKLHPSKRICTRDEAESSGNSSNNTAIKTSQCSLPIIHQQVKSSLTTSNAPLKLSDAYKIEKIQVKVVIDNKKQSVHLYPNSDLIKSISNEFFKTTTSKTAEAQIAYITTHHSFSTINKATDTTLYIKPEKIQSQIVASISNNELTLSGGFEIVIGKKYVFVIDKDNSLLIQE